MAAPGRPSTAAVMWNTADETCETPIASYIRGRARPVPVPARFGREDNERGALRVARDFEPPQRLLPWRDPATGCRARCIAGPRVVVAGDAGQCRVTGRWCMHSGAASRWHKGFIVSKIGKARMRSATADDATPAGAFVCRIQLFDAESGRNVETTACYQIAVERRP